MGATAATPMSRMGPETAVAASPQQRALPPPSRPQPQRLPMAT